MPRTLTRLAGPAAAVALAVTSLAAPATAGQKAPVARWTATSAATAATTAPRTAAVRLSRADRAVRALHRAEALARPRTTKAPGHTRNATLVLRDLIALRSALSPADRAKAARILARPTDLGSSGTLVYTTGQAAPYCNAHLCIHYVTSTVDAVSLTDGNANGIPDYVEQTLSVMEHVRSTYVAAGYRPTKSDGSKGGNSKTDIYLGELGSKGLYGYCTSDQPIRPHHYDLWSYCALDNDYAGFPTHTPLENTEVTAAHEYFHAVQFAYDAFEDSWLMEATATWAEDELYTSVNDNLQYLPYGQLGSRYWESLDTFDNSSTGFEQYGNWIFFRYLSEKFSKSAGGLPVIVRSIWRLADGAKGGKDDYSIQAVADALKAQKTSLTKEYALFTERNHFAQTYYDEGTDNAYPQTAYEGAVTLSPSLRTSTWYKTTLQHLASKGLMVTPSGLTSSTWKLKVTVDMGAQPHVTAVVLDRFLTSGNHDVRLIKLNAKGDGSLVVPFNSNSTTYVSLSLVNAGVRYHCWKRTSYSCQGSSQDNKVGAAAKVQLIK